VRPKVTSRQLTQSSRAFVTLSVQHPSSDDALHCCVLRHWGRFGMLVLRFHGPCVFPRPALRGSVTTVIPFPVGLLAGEAPRSRRGFGVTESCWVAPLASGAQIPAPGLLCSGRQEPAYVPDVPVEKKRTRTNAQNHPAEWGTWKEASMGSEILK